MIKLSDLLLERIDYLTVATGIVKQYGLKSKVKFGSGKDLADYKPEIDTIYLRTSYSNLKEYYKTVNIRTTFAGKFINNPKRFRLSLLYGMHSMENINLSNYDVVISSSASIAKYIKANKGKHFSYCYYPTRAIWEADKYFGRSILKYLIKPL